MNRQQGRQSKNDMHNLPKGTVTGKVACQGLAGAVPCPRVGHVLVPVSGDRLLLYGGRRGPADVLGEHALGLFLLASLYAEALYASVVVVRLIGASTSGHLLYALEVQAVWSLLLRNWPLYDVSCAALAVRGKFELSFKELRCSASYLGVAALVLCLQRTFAWG